MRPFQNFGWGELASDTRTEILQRTSRKAGEATRHLGKARMTVDHTCEVINDMNRAQNITSLRLFIPTSIFHNRNR